MGYEEVTISSPGSVSGLQRLMASELQLMVGIIPVQHKKKIFEIIGRDSLDLVVKETVYNS